MERSKSSRSNNNNNSQHSRTIRNVFGASLIFGFASVILSTWQSHLLMVVVDTEEMEMNMPLRLKRTTTTKFDNENLTLTIMSQQSNKPPKKSNRQSTISTKIPASTAAVAATATATATGRNTSKSDKPAKLFQEEQTTKSTADRPMLPKLAEPKKETVQSKINQTGTTETRSITIRRNFAQYLSSNSSKEFHHHLDPEDESGFSACLLTMEDNHYLIEWLAYHYHFLPLRRLIIAVDPASRTSPQAILDRYQGYMDISLWNDTDVFGDKEIPEQAVFRHRRRQSLLISRCLAQFVTENRTWVSVIDTDEYVVVHRAADAEYRADDNKPTLYQMLQSPKNQNARIPGNASCVNLRRAQMSIQSSTTTLDVGSEFWNASQFNTVQFRHRAQYFMRDGKRRSMAGKTMVHAQRITEESLDFRYVGPHRSSTKCPMGKIRVPPHQAAYLIHHYPGTFAQYTFRAGSDPRNNVRTLDRYNELNFTTAEETSDLPYTWVQDFTRKVGAELALRLLEGIGTVENLPPVNITSTAAGNITLRSKNDTTIEDLPPVKTTSRAGNITLPSKNDANNEDLPPVKATSKAGTITLPSKNESTIEEYPPFINKTSEAGNATLHSKNQKNSTAS
jgi:hypothetical protein